MTNNQKIAWQPLTGSQTLAMACPAQHILYHGTRGPGKGLPVNEPVYTPNGPVEIGKLQENDEVLCPDGSVSRVVGVYPQGQRPTYKLTFADGSIAFCDDQHKWDLHVGGKFKAGTYKTYNMTEVIKMFNVGCYRLNIPTLDKLNYPEKTFKIDPYLLGLYLGDGTFAQHQTFCTIDQELADYVIAQGGQYYYQDSRNTLKYYKPPAGFREAINELGIASCRSKTKYVPRKYKLASHGQRLALLQGLMDTDGTVDKKGYVTFTSSSLKLANDVQWLARSLGAKATLTNKPSVKAYNVYIQAGNKFVPFKLRRKAGKVKGYMHKHLTNKIVSIEEQGLQETVCIKIAHPKGLFITRDCVVTHNTDAQLMRFRRYVGLGYGAFWRGIIFDMQYKNLDDIVSKSKRWFPEFFDGAKFKNSTADYKWVWPTGEELLIRVAEKEADYNNYHGQEFPFIGWNELTKYPDSKLYDLMMSCNRSSFVPEERPVNQYGQPYEGKPDEQKIILPEIPLQTFSTCNPHGRGHNWVKKKFINKSKMGQIHKTSIRVFNPRTQQKEDVVKTQCHIFGSYRENKYLSPTYVAELESIDDPNKREAWLKGNWDITAGGMFDDLWRTDVHVVKPFDIPHSWKINRSFDWGSSAPFSVGWWAESDGSDVRLANGKLMSTVRGDLFRISEWYGTSGKPNEGLRMLATDVAKGIRERELKLPFGDRVQSGPADNSIFDVQDGNSIAVNMMKTVRINGVKYSGVQWLRSDKSAGSRKAGWELCRARLKAALPVKLGVREQPGLFVFDNCEHFIDLFPILPRDEKDLDDVDTKTEDHIGDEVRYRVLGSNRGMVSGKTVG